MVSVDKQNHRRQARLGLQAGDLIEIRSEREILATLDDQGKLGGLQFMPEMLQYCGRQVRVFRRADKTCDTIRTSKSMRMLDTVHLADLRCDGTAHGGCEAACLLFWKEAWLKPVPEPTGPAVERPHIGVSHEQLYSLTVRREDAEAQDGPTYVCQATTLLEAGTLMEWWDIRQYWRELRSGNVSLGTMVRTLLRSWYGVMRRAFGDRKFPYLRGPLEGKTPSLPQPLDLRAGECVRVRSRDEVMATLNRKRKNRGLYFDVEMEPYCGEEHRVLRRVNRIINERTGKMMVIPGDCVMLDGVVCNGLLSRDRLFCPRSIYPYWREIWLHRTDESA